MAPLILMPPLLSAIVNSNLKDTLCELMAVNWFWRLKVSLEAGVNACENSLVWFSAALLAEEVWEA